MGGLYRDSVENELAESDSLPTDETPHGAPIGYVVTWTTPDGRRGSQWYKRRGNARNKIRRLGETGKGLNPRLFRTESATDITADKDITFDALLAEARREWASSPWRQRLLREEAGWADFIRSRRWADRLLDGLESRMSRAGRLARRQERS